MNIRRKLLALTGLVLAGLSVAPVLAQEEFPNKPLNMLVPFPPGGVADAVGRPVAEAMGRALKQSMVVENKGGAGGGIGMAQVAKSRADGYNVLMALSSIVVLPEADKVLQRADVHARPAQTDCAFHRRPDRAGGQGRESVEDLRGLHR
jgi:tripartite-type tricarboxylate transporter receptor subunit TctC